MNLEQKKNLFRRAERAGEIAQSLFYTFIENTWTYDMSNVRIVRDQNGELFAIEVIAGQGVKTGPGGESTCGRHAGGWLIRFPYASFQDRDERVKCALLADHNSIWAFVFMHAVIQVLFTDLVDDATEDVKEVVHYLPSTARRLIEYKGYFGLVRVERGGLLYPEVDGRGGLKAIYTIRLKDGTNIVLDLAGAQHALPHMAMTPWSTYCSHVESIKYRVPFRSHFLKHAVKISNYRCITHLTIVMQQTWYFNQLVTHSKERLGFQLRDLLEMDHDEYRVLKYRLISQAREYLLKVPKELDHGVPSSCLARSLDLRHPRIVAQLRKPTSLVSLSNAGLSVSLPFDIGDMKHFNWLNLRKLIQLPNDVAKYREKKKAKNLLSYRCAYKLPGDWKLVFLHDTLPDLKVPAECVSENPYWKGR